MALDPARWTVKTRDAFQAGSTQSAAAGNPYVTPAHLLLALLSQADGIARPLLVAAGLDPLHVTASLNEQLAREPRAVGGAQPGLSPEARRGLGQAGGPPPELSHE